MWFIVSRLGYPYAHPTFTPRTPLGSTLEQRGVLVEHLLRGLEVGGFLHLAVLPKLLHEREEVLDALLHALLRFGDHHVRLAEHLLSLHPHCRLLLLCPASASSTHWQL